MTTPVQDLSFFDDIKAYVGFTDADAAALAGFEPLVAPHYERIADHFYECILAHPKAHAAIRGGEAQVNRLKRTLVDWMRTGLLGPHDERYYHRRTRIGRVHVQIDLPQQYMLTAMDVFRIDLRQVVEETYAGEAEGRRRLNDAVDRLLDMELAIMLQTYKEDSEDRLRRKERLATIGQLAAGIGHDLRNPLGVIESSLYLLRRRDHDEKVSRHLEKISAQVKICGEIITDLMEMARNRPPKRSRVDVGALIADVVASVPVPPDVTVLQVVDECVEIDADPGLLRQALANLVSNAALALESSGGRIRVSGEALEREVVLTVADDGPGFDPATLSQAFEPLVTGREQGVGLGLALVQSIARRHGGSAEAENRMDGPGAVIRIRLPRTEADEAGAEEEV
jgi:signal transduction histidine kinase